MKYIVYTDGSYKKLADGREAYSSAAITAKEGITDWKVFAKAANDEYTVYHNFAGEILAAIMVFDYLLKQGDCTEVTVYHDYEGVGAWPTGKWKKTNNDLSKMYKDFMLHYVIPKIKIEWIWTPGHTGVEGNEIVDQIAKDALKKYFSEGV